MSLLPSQLEESLCSCLLQNSLISQNRLVVQRKFHVCQW